MRKHFYIDFKKVLKVQMTILVQTRFPFPMFRDQPCSYILYRHTHMYLNWQQAFSVVCWERCMNAINLMKNRLSLQDCNHGRKKNCSSTQTASQDFINEDVRSFLLCLYILSWQHVPFSGLTFYFETYFNLEFTSFSK